MRSVTVEPTVWRDPLFKATRILRVVEPLNEDPVTVLIRVDIADAFGSLFECSCDGDRFVTPARIRQIQHGIRERCDVDSFYHEVSWELADRARLRPLASASVRPLTPGDLPAIDVATRRGNIPTRSDLLGFNGAYGYFDGAELLSWANIVDMDDHRSDVGNVYTLPDSRRKGCASAVVTACVAEILSRHRIAYGGTAKGNGAMNAVYRKLGFSEVQESFEAIEKRDRTGPMHATS